MGEIKSTLDLVMERTRNMAFTDEERARQKKEDYRKRVRGIVSRCVDGLIPISRVEKELAALNQESGMNDSGILEKEIKGQIDPDRDNHMALNLLEITCKLPVKGIRDLLSSYKRDLETLSEETMIQIKEVLKNECAISGTAVVPNIDKNESFLEKKNAIRMKYLEKITSRAAG